MLLRIMNHVVAITLIVLAGWWAPLAWAERVWDDDLNRYLTPDELGYHEIYLTPDEAAKLIFSESQSIRKDTLSLTPHQKAAIQQQIGWRFPETSFECYIGKTDGAIDGWALIQNTIGKHKPMTYMVGVDPHGEIISVEVLAYRESRGSEVRKKRFNYQFEGKTRHNPIRINRDIINISGATMSVRSMSAGVKRALVLVDELYLKPRGLESPTMVAGDAKKMGE